jgi:hypothetical protein
MMMKKKKKKKLNTTPDGPDPRSILVNQEMMNQKTKLD